MGLAHCSVRPAAFVQFQSLWRPKRAEARRVERRRSRSARRAPISAASGINAGRTTASVREAPVKTSKWINARITMMTKAMPATIGAQNGP